jgi:2-dehydro-3-deoxyphosphooctonate aldolase (KDO 8-P synthase)
MSFYDPDKFILMAGPCALENMDVCEAVAEMLCGLRDKFPELKIVFKGSFDKANRTSIHSPRGPGLAKGLEYLNAIKEKYGFPVVTDIHEPDQAEPVGEVCDVIQIPAFLCRQTDLLVAAAETGKIVNVKKGQFLSPMEMQFVINKLEEVETTEIWQTVRGTTFGYQNLIVDMRDFSILKGYGHPAILDATHSVQLPGAGGGKTTGQREFVPALARAAVAAGADGLFCETHPNPDQAISDGPNQIPVAEFPALVESVLKIWHATRS